jgi:arabinan endo-1,5-alpha-L-arabinosidase
MAAPGLEVRPRPKEHDPMLTIVVARYKEDVAWLNDLPADWRVYLYNKGPEVAHGTLRAGIEVHALPNTGREAHTYLHHLRRHFHADEGEFTVFTQADPFEHSPGFLHLLRLAAYWRDVQPLSLHWMASKNIPPRHLISMDRRDWLGGIPIRSEYFSLHTLAPVAFFDAGGWGLYNSYRLDHSVGTGHKAIEHFFGLCGLYWLAEQARDSDLGAFAWGAIFGVRNSRIAAFLERARPQLERMEVLTSTSASVYACMFERCWLLIFGEPMIRLPALRSRAAADAPAPAMPEPFIETVLAATVDAERVALRRRPSDDEVWRPMQTVRYPDYPGNVDRMGGTGQIIRYPDYPDYPGNVDRMGGTGKTSPSVATTERPARAPLQMPKLAGKVVLHDPSIIVTKTGWAAFGTGYMGGAKETSWDAFTTGARDAATEGMPQTRISSDGVTWKDGGVLPGGLPAWIPRELGYVPLHVWGPDVSMHDGIGYLYYSVGIFGRNDSAIGLMTNPAFDAARPAESWIDRGMVLRSQPGDKFNAISSCRVNTSDGRAWLAFGSFWGGIHLVELDPATGLRRGDAPPYCIASRGNGPIEDPAILEQEGRFYLFVSFDFCCRGSDSTYRLMVGRADRLEGPYLDRDGRPMLAGGGTELLKSTGRYCGPGGEEVFVTGGQTWLAFHYYDRDQGGVPKMQLAPLGWSTDGWPEVGPLP